MLCALHNSTVGRGDVNKSGVAPPHHCDRMNLAEPWRSPIRASLRSRGSSGQVLSLFPQECLILAEGLLMGVLGSELGSIPQLWSCLIPSLGVKMEICCRW